MTALPLAARTRAARPVSGSLTPHGLAAAIRRHFGHSPPLAERLAALDDEYDLGAYATMTREQVDQEVIAEARRLMHAQPDQRTAHDNQNAPIGAPKQVSPRSRQPLRSAGRRAVIRRSSCRRPPSPVPATAGTQPNIYTSPRLRRTSSTAA